MKPSLVVLLSLVLLAGCAMPLGGGTATEPTATEKPVEPSDTPPPTAEPTVTFPPEPPGTATTLPPPTPFTPFSVTTMVDNANLRSNPGYLFDIITVLDQDYPLLVYGKAPGGEWLFVQTLDHVNGWLFTQLVQSEGDLESLLASLPVIAPLDVQVIEGNLVNDLNEPINGIQFALTQGEGNDALRNDAMTDLNGHFFLFMPNDAEGEWAISYVAISCESVVMDPGCNRLPQYNEGVVPDYLELTLPLDEELEFVYK